MLTAAIVVLGSLNLGLDAGLPSAGERAPRAACLAPYAEVAAPLGRSPAHFESDEHSAADRVWLGVELQAYPAGVITGVSAQFPLSDRDVLTARLAYNRTERRDFGEHDDESGGGPGIGVGWRRYFGPDLDGWMVGGRLDVWALRIDWEDDVPARSGHSDVIVLQPAVEGGYAFLLGERVRLDLGLALGVELNVHTDGESVGQGAILLGGVGLTYGF